MSIISKKVTALRALLFGVIITAILFAAEFLLAIGNENQVSAASRPGDIITLTYDGSGRDNLAFYYDVDGYWGTTHYYRIAGSHLVFCAEVDAGWAEGQYRVIKYVNSNEYNGVRKDDLIKLMLFIWENRNTESSAVNSVFGNWISGGQGSYQSFELDGLTFSGYLDEYYAFTHAIVGYMNDGHYMYDMPQWRINNAVSALASLVNNNDGVWQRAKSKTVFGAVPVEGGDKQLVVWLEDGFELETTAVDNDDEDKFVENDSLVTIKDTVEYRVEPNITYTLTGTLMDKTTGEPVVYEGVAVEESTEISTTDDEGRGTAVMTFTFDASELAGRELVVFERLYLDDELVFEHADLNDESQTVTVVSLGTTASGDADNDKYAEVGENATIVDTVSYCATPNTRFAIKGKLINKSDNDAVVMESDTVNITVPASGCGTEDITFEFDGTGLGGDTLVVFETLYNGNDIVIEHADLNDENQSIVMVSLDSEAKDQIDGDKFIEVGDDIIIRDTVKYCAAPGSRIVIKGELMDKNENEPIVQDGDPVVVIVPVTVPESGCGSKDVLFNIDGSEFGGKEIVIFESLLTEDNVIILEHDNLDDLDQTVTIISLGTTAVDDEDDDKFIIADEHAIIKDTVEYCITPDQDFVIRGYLVDKETGEPLLIDDEMIEGIATVRSDTGCGTEEIFFDIDASELAGKEIVVFEELIYDDEVILEHADINDEGQTVTIVSLGTTAVDDADDDKYVEIVEGEDVTIKDVVEYCVKPNMNYRIEGILMDKETGEPVLINDEEVTSFAEINPEEGCGSVDILFTFDAKELGGKELVAFETLYYYDENDELVYIMEHADIDDEGQTVRLISLRTYATNKETGDKILPFGEDVVINDRVYYCLLVGEEYTIRGILMNRETGEPILINGQPVTDEVTFTPEEDCCGEFDMTYKLNTGELGGAKLVIFENLYHDGELIIEHMNLANVDESLDVEDPPVPDTGSFTKEESSIKETDKYAMIFGGISVIALVGLSIIIVKYATNKA